MLISCQQCNHEFDHEPTFGQGDDLVVCPSCGRDAGAGGDMFGGDGDLFGGGGGDMFGGGGDMFAGGGDGLSGGGGGGDARVYCFNCGKAMTPREGELIPVCDECRQDASQTAEPGPAAVAAPGAGPGDSLPPGMTDEPIADWMIRKANGNVYGPFPSETIVDWIKARKINPDEEIAHIGGAWRLFGQHEEFGKNFETTSEVKLGTQTTSEIDFRRRSPVRDAFRSSARLIIVVAVLVVIGGGVWYAISADLLVVPESAINRVAEQVSDTTTRSETGQPVSEDARTILFDLGEKHAELYAEGAEPGSSMEHFLRGRTLLMRDSVTDMRAARTEMEQAVVLDRRNPLALAGLAEVYSLLAYRGLGPLDLQRQAIYLIDLAEAEETYQSEVLRARAGWLIYTGDKSNLREGVTNAQSALQKNPADPALHFLLGVAAASRESGISDEARGHFDKALELDPGFHQVWYELGRGEEEAGHLRTAIEHYEKKIALDGRSGGAHTRLGLIYERVGDPTRAAAHYDKAVGLNPQDQVAASRRGILAYQVDGAPARAATILAPLLEEGDGKADLSIRERKEIGVHLSAALRLAGDHAGALEAIRAVLKEDANYPAGLFHKALALTASGKPGEAIPLLTRADSPDLESSERALVHFWAGRVATLADQRQDALESYTRAIEADPNFMPAYLWRAEVNLEIGNAGGAAAGLLEHIGRDPMEYARVREPGLLFEPLPDLTPLSELFRKEAKAIAFAPELYTATGITLFHQGRHQDAETWLKKAIEQDPRQEGAHFYRALASYRGRRFAAAGGLLRAALEVAHNRGVYHVYLADTLLEQDRLDEAIISYEKGIGYGADSGWSHARLAEAFARKGEEARARTELDKALKADPTAVAARRLEFELGL
jgi:tetratricopeptide (TPR) repeat protein